MFDSFPAPGFRDAGYYGRLGTLFGVGSNGFSWSAATSGIFSLDLNFNLQGLIPSNPDCHGNGFQLRCLSE